jgi:hypothetical protein
MTRTTIIADCETTALVPDYATGAGVIWEFAVQVRPPEGGRCEHLWRMKPAVAVASEEALSVGRFYERTADMCATCKNPRGAHDILTLQGAPEWSSPAALAGEVALLLNDVTLLAANPTFDAGFLAAFLAKYGHAGTWHYRLRDIGSMAYGYLCAQREAGTYYGDIPPIDAGTDDFALALGVHAFSFERHSALGDVRLAAAMLDAIEGIRRPS